MKAVDRPMPIPQPEKAALSPMEQEVREEFHSSLVEARVGELKATITNRAPWQTRMATLELLEYARELRKRGDDVQVRILSGTATEFFYCKEVADSLEACIQAGCKIKLLVWNEMDRQPSAQLLEMESKYNDMFSIRGSGTRSMGDKIPHFLLVQNRAYRAEHSHDYLDGIPFTDYTPETKARICFNDEVTGSELEKFFDSVWDVGNSYTSD